MDFALQRPSYLADQFCLRIHAEATLSTLNSDDPSKKIFSPTALQRRPPTALTLRDHAKEASKSVGYGSAF